MKTVLVTGAAKGIGYETARQLASAGWQVLLAARNGKAGRKAADSLQGGKGKVSFVELDVADASSIAQAVREVAALTDQLDVLINNAGVIVDGDDSILEVSSAVVSATLATNTLGPLAVAQAFLPLLRKSKAPRIVNVSSGGGQLGESMGTWSPAYCLSKTALNAVTNLLASALPDFAVNSVCPGWVQTDMGGAEAPRSVEEGADGIVWLASEAPQELSEKFLRDREVIAW
ncbi:SDR family oxidoreductase [soil metagenome]